MTNNEILQASVLDIIFEHRNKDYGAYALRRGYNARMLTALGAGMSVIVLLVLLTSVKRGTIASADIQKQKEEIVIRTVQLPEEPARQPEQPKQTVKARTAVKQVAQVKFTPPKIVEIVKDPVASVDELKGKDVSVRNTDGEPDDKKVVIAAEPVQAGTGKGPSVTDSEKEFLVNEREPEFPGGAEALKKFLSRYLTTPDQLEAGEKKVVRIRFKVDKDGTVNTFEIVTSAGSNFDNEVVRVCRKMPRWMPAIQNGINVPVSYVLPVTFIGQEE